MKTRSGPRTEQRKERHAAIERRYTYRRRHEDSGLSTPAMVAAHVDELVQAFLRVRGQADLFENAADPIEELKRWEEDRFGHELEPSAHGILAFAVKRALASAAAVSPSTVASPAEPTEPRG